MSNHHAARISARFPVLCIGLLAVLLCACTVEPPEASQTEAAPWVRTAVAERDPRQTVRISGIVRARFEQPLAFQLRGRILSRHVDAGEHVEAGQLLFTLDSRDQRQQLTAAEARFAATQAELENASRELSRQRDLVTRQLTSQQGVDVAELNERAARARLRAAEADLRQAENLLSYTELRAGAAGLVMDLRAEAGQVVDSGEPVLVLAEGEERDIEVMLPSAKAPTQISLAGSSGPLELPLRELSGAADPVTRAWPARYSLPDTEDFPLRSVVRVSFGQDVDQMALRLPVAAIDERGNGPQVWVIQDGRASPLPVSVLALEREHALVSAAIEPGTTVVALGAHLLQPGQSVREWQP